MRRGNKRANRYKTAAQAPKNTIVPAGQHTTPRAPDTFVRAQITPPDKTFMEAFLRESMHCGKCREIFSLSSDELKIHCNICNDFFHCGIAGECIGGDCLIKGDGGSKHRARYCVNCVSKVYKNDTCLCNSCATK
jgi:hypothetical protein